MTNKDAQNLAKMIVSIHVSNLKCFSDLYHIAEIWAMHEDLDDFIIDYYRSAAEELGSEAKKMAEMYILDKAMEDGIL